MAKVFLKVFLAFVAKVSPFQIFQCDAIHENPSSYNDRYPTLDLGQEKLSRTGLTGISKSNAGKNNLKNLNKNLTKE